jgi:hypothetical protein
VVNAGLVAAINQLPSLTFPTDGGLRAGLPIGSVDFVAQGGDIANRSEADGAKVIQSAARSWSQFVDDYANGLTVRDHTGARAPLFVVPGNHDASNAVGFWRPMRPLIDKTAVVEIYNRMMAPATPKTAATFDYARDPVVYTRDLGGVHFAFLRVWPDSAMRAWLAHDLASVNPSTPVIVIVHDQPDPEPKHFINPNGSHGITAADKFENLLADRFADGATIDGESVTASGELEAFVRQHPNVVAYFHGNSNWNQFYDWSGPGKSAALHVFRVDSPMKGAVSAKDEKALSFHVATISAVTHAMTVRDCLWNTEPRNAAAPIRWGAVSTVSLYPRPTS